MSEAKTAEKTPCLAVFTCRGINRILRERGSQAWRLSSSRASKIGYIVCVQTRNFDWGNPSHPHGTAFLVGKIAGITKVDTDANGVVRKIVEISEYAEINVPHEWTNGRNPIGYMTLEDFDLKLDELEFQAIPSLAPETDESFIDEVEQSEMPGDDYAAITRDEEIPIPVNDEAFMSLSIDDAKKGLARRFGVSIEQIDITIRG